MPLPPNRVAACSTSPAPLSQERATPTGRMTRATGSNKQPTHDELINDRDSAVRGVDGAAKLLISKGYLIEDTTPSINALSYVLLQIAATSKEKTFRELLRAISILIDHSSTDNSVDSIASAIEARLERKLDKRLATASKQWEQSAAGIAKLVHTQPPAAPRPQPAPITYAAAAQSAKVAAFHSKALFRTNLRARQVIVDTDDESTYDLSEKEITAKARLALEAVYTNLGYENDPDQLGDVKFLGATKLKNGGIILELNSPEAVSFLTDDETLTEFLAAFGGQATVKTRGFQCIAEFVPTSFLPNAPSSLRAVESDSRLPDRAILKARWIKPVERRSPGQKVAHLFLDFDSTYSANRAIDNGIFIENKKVNVRKAKVEPRRCLKCQSFGARHIANTCPSPTDVCGFCSGKHRTSECEVSDPNNFRCANCKQTGHTVWDKTCPVYKQQAQLLDERCPENRFRLFPADDDPMSWESFDDGTHTDHPSPDNTCTPTITQHNPEQDDEHEQPADGPIARGRNARSRTSRSRASSAHSQARSESTNIRPPTQNDGTLDSFLRKAPPSQPHSRSPLDPRAHK